MNFLGMIDKSKIRFIVLGFIVLGIFIYLVTPQLDREICLENNLKKMGQSYSGKVSRIYRDSSNRLHPTFQFKDGGEFDVNSPDDILYKKVQVRDSLWKHAGTFDVYLKKYPSGKVYRFNIEEDCN